MYFIAAVLSFIICIGVPFRFAAELYVDFSYGNLIKAILLIITTIILFGFMGIYSFNKHIHDKRYSIEKFEVKLNTIY